MMASEIVSFWINFPQRPLEHMTENRGIEKHVPVG
jgi:hypothetical protein